MVKKKKVCILFVLFIVMTFMQSIIVMGDEMNKDKKLTILYYCDADNDLEEDLLNDIEEMKKGYNNNPNLNLIALVDRSPKYSCNPVVLGEDFDDTRLYKIEHNSVKRLDGGNEFPEITLNSNYEANMGDPETLKKFINYGKANYKADKYVLIISNHGNGAKDKKKKKLSKAVCWDDSHDDGNSSDCLYIGEISDYLTEEQSIDVLVFDACLMGTAEVAYQYRPGNGSFSADAMIASSPSVWAEGFKYDKIFSRIKGGKGCSDEEDLTLGGKEQTFDPSTITNEQLGALFIEEQRDALKDKWRNDQQLSYYDLNKIEGVKKSVDELAVNLSNENKKQQVCDLRGRKRKTTLIHYFDESDEDDWCKYPYFDLYDLCEQISINKNFNEITKKLALKVMHNIDNMIVYSFSGDLFKGTHKFIEGKNGISIFLPDGDGEIIEGYTGYKFRHWETQGWYNSIDTRKVGIENSYGKLKWCQDGQNPEINKVGNWFELLDSWFDKSNDKNGGINYYQW
ncbi:clostripain [Clostridiaceae bacterium 14S0207]|nr:clostripain [Clostridiaceae bacterium 14S0207]